MRHSFCHICLFCLLISLFNGHLHGQENEDNTPDKIEILNANKLKYMERGNEKIRKLIGDVKLKQKGVTMDCDSAYQFPDENRIKAFHSLHIRQGDSIHLTGNLLRYNGNTRKAIIKESVRLEEDSVTLRTDTLNYDMGTSRAFYTTGGIIEDTNNRLTSKKGYYHSNTKNFFFQDSVRLHNPDYTIYCDTLRYESPTEKAYFYGPTRIISDTNLLYCENGWYDTKNDLARFGKNAYLRSGAKKLFADSLFYDRDRSYGKARFNIRLLDTARNLQITGENGEYYENNRPSYITDSVLARKIEASDTIYLHADTLKTTRDTAGNQILKGYYGAKTFETEFQTQCDSLVYATQDSLITLNQNPVLWRQHYQMTGEQVKLHTNGKGKIEKMVITNDGLIASKITGNRFNQVKGRKMIGYFNDNELQKMDVIGNAQAIYYLTNEAGKFRGINKIKASNLTIAFKEQEIENITFREQPEGTVHPPGPEDRSQFELSGFQWLGQERPNQIVDLFKPFVYPNLKAKEQEKEKQIIKK